MSTSECSSGCESSWTMYLDQHSSSLTNQYCRDFVESYEDRRSPARLDDIDDQEDDGDHLSMMSDATSGPPPLHQKYYIGLSSVSQGMNEGTKESSKSKEQQRMGKNKHGLCLDDTATSPILHFSQDNAAPSKGHISQVFSATHFEEGEWLPTKHLNLFTSEGKPGKFVGKKRQ